MAYFETWEQSETPALPAADQSQDTPPQTVSLLTHAPLQAREARRSHCAFMVSTKSTMDRIKMAVSAVMTTAESPRGPLGSSM